jgi:hypothetical protein
MALTKLGIKDFIEKRTKHAYWTYCTILEEAGGNGLMKVCIPDITEEV